ncbi:hypothetical protein L249_2409 [Ophiocordyceps polyrhachis-furcata BCC 54312]|uniref:Ribosomal protein/NADH dehydrogenase domain-containing protein n=1 Tax=Ophiocordyceps polyrhachis-furcata BCC 54312 TaxID=1330021 RepID=A0A367LSI0_9HYPO|nr:hypothetical protein L249_2409 [Ophiocordyceps polyrhachis-furcata BCC 54312]
MRSLGSRLTVLREPSQLIKLRCGPGAAVLPSEVKRIHLDFALSMYEGHMGARKFWRECLTRLKYHNPGISMIVNRHNDNKSPPIMTIYFGSPTAQPASGPVPSSDQLSSSRQNLAKALPPGKDERTVKIEMKDKHSDEILDMFLAETKATAIPTTDSDVEEMQALETMKRMAAAARERRKLEKEQKKKEEELLKKATDVISSAAE